MTIETGDRLGLYGILARLGAGGWHGLGAVNEKVAGMRTHCW